MEQANRLCENIAVWTASGLQDWRHLIVGHWLGHLLHTVSTPNYDLNTQMLDRTVSALSTN